MASGHDVKHDYHLVNPSPWPILASIAMFVLAIGGVTYMHGGLIEKGPLNAFFTKGNPLILGIGFLSLVLVMIGWWGDVIKEGQQGHHTPVVDIHLRYGMIMFIASEVMFFVAWFWAYFELAIFHETRAAWTIAGDPEAMKAWANWPPPNVETFDPFHLPLMNTLILLLSGTTVTWAHHALQQGDRNGARLGLIFTIALGILFTAIQAYEYSIAGFAFGNTGDTTTANLYGSTFFMATGFHGAHVVIGTLFLIVCLIRLFAGQMTPQKHFGFEAAAWYWHFVDVVWLFLFAFVYVTPHLAMGG
jgi:cytochrome c oxidase subunit 3